MMSQNERDWLSLTEASDWLGIHPTTLRRWADEGSVPHFRTPGGHRRFRSEELDAWMQGKQTKALAPPGNLLLHSALGYTREVMADQGVSGEPWYIAFGHEEERQYMRDTGRKLFGLALQYMSRTRNHEPTLQEGRRIGQSYGEQCAGRGVSLANTVRALFFFRESLLRASRPGQAHPGHYDAEDVRIHRQLRHFLDEVMYSCLDSYEATCRHLLGGEAKP
jgi:excisionase family DNA binding protein